MWLVVRSAEALLCCAAAVSDKNHRRACRRSTRGLASLALPGPPMKRALAAARHHREPAPRRALVRPSSARGRRELLGHEAGDAITVATESARNIYK